MQISFILNDKPINLELAPEERLIDILREKLHLHGTKESCGEGQCGACSVLINNKLVLACLTPAVKIQGADIKTIEYLSDEISTKTSEDKYIPNYIQKAFIDANAIQCGFCTPGIIMLTKFYIEQGGKNDRELIKKALSGNICRCTGYSHIIDAVQLAFEYKETQQK